MEQEIVLGREWFFNVDLYTSLFSIIVISLIAFFVTKAYNLTRNKKYLAFMVSMYMLDFAFICRVVSSVFAYINNVDFKVLGLEFLKTYQFFSINYWFAILFILFELFTLIGMYLFYNIYSRNDALKTKILVIFLLAMSVILSYFFYYVFYMTLLVILVFISLQHWHNFYENNIGNTALLAASFSIIAFAQAIFILTSVQPQFYTTAAAVQSIGYVLLLITFILVLSHGKKTKQARYNRRHA